MLAKSSRAGYKSIAWQPWSNLAFWCPVTRVTPGRSISYDKMSYLSLKVIHLIGLALTFMGLAGALASSTSAPAPSATRRIFAVSHGVGLVILLASGFTLALQLGIGRNLPGWIWGKLVIWLLAGVTLTLVRRFSRFQVSLLVYFVVLVGLAAWLALYKPF